MTMEGEGYPIKGVVASKNGRDSNDEMEHTDNETKKKGGNSNGGRKGGKITSTPSRPGVQVTPNDKLTGGQPQDPPKKSRYIKGQLEAFFGTGTRVTAPGKQKDQPTRTKMAAAPDDDSNKKVRLEDKYTDERRREEGSLQLTSRQWTLH